jgi:hypothetical protein
MSDETGILFLDIEGTLIESMDSPNFLTTILDSDWLKNLISKSNEIHCFSWAICNPKELESSKWLIRAIEERLDIRFKTMIFRDDLFLPFRKQFGNFSFMEFEEMCRLLGKESIFQFFIRNVFERKEHTFFTLVDDMVEDTILSGAFGSIQTIRVKA